MNGWGKSQKFNKRSNLRKLKVLLLSSVDKRETSALPVYPKLNRIYWALLYACWTNQTTNSEGDHFVFRALKTDIFVKNRKFKVVCKYNTLW